MSKPRDPIGNDWIVASTALAMQIARAAGLEGDKELIRKLSNGFHDMELKRIKNEQDSKLP